MRQEYFLLPSFLEDGSWFVSRSQSSTGTGRRFHVASQESVDTLRGFVGVEETSSAGDWLQKAGEDLDRKIDEAGNGVLLVGGLVALANPLAGVGMVLGHSIVGKLVGQGIRSATEGAATLLKKGEGAMRGKVARAHVLVNPLVAATFRLAHEAPYDPCLDTSFMDEMDDLETYILSAATISAAYREIEVPAKVRPWIERLRIEGSE